MSLLSLSLVVLAAFIHATWNLLSKRAADAGPTFVFAYNLFACLVYLPWMISLLVYGELNWSLPVAGCLVLSACIHLAYSLCLQRGYQVADFSVVYPIARGTGPMLSSIGAFILLRETPTLQGIVGLLAVVAGIGFITTQGDLSAFRRPRGLDGGHRDGRAAQPGRARARNVDDGGRAVRHADPRRAGHGMAGGGLRDFDWGRGAAGIGEGLKRDGSGLSRRAVPLQPCPARGERSDRIKDAIR